MANSRFFSSPAHEMATGSFANVLISPGNYGKSINAAQASLEALRTKLRQAGIEFDEDGDAQIEIGNTDWDKHVMRVKLLINSRLSAEELDKTLASEGFISGLPKCF
jgi:hypothetical protein